MSTGRDGAKRARAAASGTDQTTSGGGAIGAGAGPGGGPRLGGGAGRVAGYLLLAVVGAVAGIAGALIQAGWFPGGLLLALLGLAGLGYSGVKITGTRTGGAAPAGGWAIVVLLLTATRPEGDFLFGAGVGSYVFLLGGMFIGVMCATLPKLPQPGTPGVRLGK